MAFGNGRIPTYTDLNEMKQNRNLSLASMRGSTGNTSMLGKNANGIGSGISPRRTVYQLQDEVQHLQSELLDMQSYFEVQLGEARSAAEAKHAAKIQTLRTRHMDRLNEAKDALEAEREEHAAASAAQDQQFAQRLEELRMEHETALSLERTKMEERLGLEHAEAAQATAAAAQAQLESTKAELVVSQNARLAATLEQHNEELVAMKEHFATRLQFHESIVRTQSEAQAIMQAEQQAQISAALAARKRLGVQHCEAMEAQQTAHQDEITLLQVEHEVALDAVVAAQRETVAMLADWNTKQQEAVTVARQTAFAEGYAAGRAEAAAEVASPSGSGMDWYSDSGGGVEAQSPRGGGGAGRRAEEGGGAKQGGSTKGG